MSREQMEKMIAELAQAPLQSSNGVEFDPAEVARRVAKRYGDGVPTMEQFADIVTDYGCEVVAKAHGKTKEEVSATFQAMDSSRYWRTRAALTVSWHRFWETWKGAALFRWCVCLQVFIAFSVVVSLIEEGWQGLFTKGVSGAGMLGVTMGAFLVAWLEGKRKEQ